MASYILIIVVISIVDIRLMRRSGHKKEIVPYIALMLLAGAVGILYLANPYRESIVSLFLGAFHIEG